MLAPGIALLNVIEVMLYAGKLPVVTELLVTEVVFNCVMPPVLVLAPLIVIVTGFVLVTKLPSVNVITAFALVVAEGFTATSVSRYGVRSYSIELLVWPPYVNASGIELVTVSSCAGSVMLFMSPRPRVVGAVPIGVFS